jgi:2-oxo-4-hydroxy-4-carboxy-5-ureidoimidazoline decarboxylase
MTIAEYLNALSADAIRETLANCCAAARWVEQMLAARPFEDENAVYNAADRAFERLSESDWLEAFAAHPLIGDVESLRRKYAATKSLAAGEQSSVSGADSATLAELAKLNHDYYGRFGFIFIVFASGKTAGETLNILKSRIDNPRELELRNAAAEQQKITHFRLHKLAEAA